MKTTTKPPPPPPPPPTRPPPPSPRKRPQPEDTHQALIQTPYGRGLILRTRQHDNMKEIQLLESETFKPPGSASLGHKNMLYTPVEYESVRIHVGDDVLCQFGRGVVTDITNITNITDITDSSMVSNGGPLLKYTIALTSWRLSSRSPVTCHIVQPPPGTQQSQQARKTQPQPSQQPQQPQQSQPQQSCEVPNANRIRVVRKRTLYEMDSHQKVEYAQELKAKATKYFVQKPVTTTMNSTKITTTATNGRSNQTHDSNNRNKNSTNENSKGDETPDSEQRQQQKQNQQNPQTSSNSETQPNPHNQHNALNPPNQPNQHYQKALETYAQSIDSVRNVQYDHTATNYVRADLILVMVTCSNNAGVCCVKLERWEEAIKYAKNALILLDALYQKRGMKIHTVLRNEHHLDSKLFGEWRCKSYLLMGTAHMERGELEEAVEALKLGRGIANAYIKELNHTVNTEKAEKADKADNADEKPELTKEEKASLKVLTSQEKEARKLLAECAENKKARLKMEKKRAKAMFGGGLSRDMQDNATKAAKLEEKEKEQQSQQQQNGAQQYPFAPSEENPPNPSECNSNRTPPTPTTPPTPPMAPKRSSIMHKSSDKPNSPSFGSRPSVRKSVSFSERPPQIKEFEKVAEEEDDIPWYTEHREALIMVALAGLGVMSFVGLRRAFRS